MGLFHNIILNLSRCYTNPLKNNKHKDHMTYSTQTDQIFGFQRLCITPKTRLSVPSKHLWLDDKHYFHFTSPSMYFTYGTCGCGWLEEISLAIIIKHRRGVVHWKGKNVQHIPIWTMYITNTVRTMLLVSCNRVLCYFQQINTKIHMYVCIVSLQNQQLIIY